MSFVLIGKLFSVIGVMFKVSSSFVFVTKASKSYQPQEKHLLVSKKKYIFEMRISILYCPQISQSVSSAIHKKLCFYIPQIVLPLPLIFILYVWVHIYNMYVNV